MTDGVIKGTGNSRYLKSVADFLTLYPDYESFAQALVAGTLPIDLNGINTSGWSTIGTKLNKSTLLTDSTASGLGLSSNATVDNALASLKSKVDTAQSTVVWRKIYDTKTTSSTTQINASISSVDVSNIYEYRLYTSYAGPDSGNSSNSGRIRINGMATDQYCSTIGLYDHLTYCSSRYITTLKHIPGQRLWAYTQYVSLDGNKSSGYVSGYSTAGPLSRINTINFYIYNNVTIPVGTTFTVYALMR